MDYLEMNLGSWNSYLPKFKDLLRPESASPLGVVDDDVEAARMTDAAMISLSTITAVLPNLVFEGYADWYGYEDEWVLRNFGHVLTSDEEDEILKRLDAGTPKDLGEVLEYIADQRLAVWQAAARDEFSRDEGEGAAETGLLRGEENRANWLASRTPGTFLLYLHR